MQKKAGKIYFIDKELTDAEVDEGYVYPVWFVVSETIIDEAGEPYEISKHIIYNRNGIKSIFTGSGGGGGGSDTLEDVRGRNNTINGDINVSAATTYFSLHQSNSLFQSEYSFDGGIAYMETYDVTNNSRSSLRLNGNSIVVDSNADLSPGLIGNKDFSSGYIDYSYIQKDYFLKNRNKYSITTSDSTPNKTWTDGVNLWFTDNLGINKNITTPTQSYKTITSNTTLDDSFHNCIVMATSNCTITVPSTLRSDFNCVFDAVGSITVTFVAGSGAILVSPWGLLLKNNSMASIYKTGSVTYRLNGSLLPA